MAKTLDELIASLKARTGIKGIATADSYLLHLAGCMEGGHCPIKGWDVSPERWAQTMKAAALSLTYHDDEMTVDSSMCKRTSQVTLGDAPPNSALVFEACFTSKKRDRDGDILEPKGCVPDQKMPLLWQHMPFEPIGKMLAITGQTDQRVMGQCAIASTELGEDAAKLTEFGALRISHGFRPLEFEPI